MKRIVRMDWDGLTHEYDLDAKRLMPWEGLNAPFGGAWCVVRPHTQSLLHDHEEHELFVCISGRARIGLDGDYLSVEKGDVVVIPPGTSHCVLNTEDEDFHMYSIWWDRDAAFSYLADSREANR